MQAPADIRLNERGLFLRGMRLIGTYIRTHPGPFAAAVVGAFLYAIGSIGSTYALGHVTNSVLVPAFRTGVPAGRIWIGVAAILAVASVRATGIGIRRYFSGMTGERMMQTIRVQVSDRYRQLPLAYHRATPTGELLAHMEADVNAAVDVLYPCRSRPASCCSRCSPSCRSCSPTRTWPRWGCS